MRESYEQMDCWVKTIAGCRAYLRLSECMIKSEKEALQHLEVKEWHDRTIEQIRDWCTEL